MTPGAILARLEAAGLHLSVQNGHLFASPKAAITDELRAMIRAHKAELLETVAKPTPPEVPKARRAVPVVPLKPSMQRNAPEGDPLSDPAAEARRKRVVALLAANPALRLAVVCDAEGDPVPVAVAIRGKGTCEVHIPAARFCPFRLLDLVAKHGSTVH